MRSPATVLTIVLLTSPAFAAPQPKTAQPIDPANVPPRCRTVAAVPRSTRTAEPALSARISVASCMGEALLADTALTDDAASIERADAATAGIIATLDEVIANGDPRSQLIAEYTKGDLLFGLETRLRESIPSITLHMTLDQTKAVEQRHRMLEPRLARWDREAMEAMRRVAGIARANPQIADGNPVVQYMTRRAERLTG